MCAELISPAAAAPPPKQTKRANVVLNYWCFRKQLRTKSEPKSRERREEATINLGNAAADDTVIAQAPP
ncbi:hypothetical protein DIPPA_23750 [Diplonema papillatum]|nr:hypothetical protein DIPPA_23750 [Diplonema papillatum]